MQRIQSVGVLSSARMMGVLYGCMGLLFVPLALLGGWPVLQRNKPTAPLEERLFSPSGSLLPFSTGHGVRVWRHRSMDR
jgi:hypothetical protein